MEKCYTYSILEVVSSAQGLFSLYLCHIVLIMTHDSIGDQNKTISQTLLSYQRSKIKRENIPWITFNFLQKNHKSFPASFARLYIYIHWFSSSATLHDPVSWIYHTYYIYSNSFHSFRCIVYCSLFDDHFIFCSFHYDHCWSVSLLFSIHFTFFSHHQILVEKLTDDIHVQYFITYSTYEFWALAPLRSAQLSCNVWIFLISCNFLSISS